MKKLTLALLAIIATSFQPEKKLKLELTVKEAQIVYQALTECDCPQQTTKSVLNYMNTEFTKQFPQKVDTVKRIDSTKKHSR